MPKLNYGKKFVAEYVIRSYNRIGALRGSHVILRDVTRADSVKADALLMPGMSNKSRYDDITETLAYEVPGGFVTEISNVEGDIQKLFGLLHQLFTEDAIKRYFNEFWIAHHNFHVTIENAKQYAAILAARKSDPYSYNVHRDCIRATDNTTVGCAAKYNARMAKKTESLY